MILEQILSLNYNFIHNFGYWILFLATFLESFPILGLFIPGSIVSFIGGFLASFQSIKLNILNFWPVIFFAGIGAILGDLAGYILGRYFGKDFIHKYGKYFLIKKEYLERASQIACNHTGKSLIIGRFHPITRSAAAFIIGANKVKLAKFMFFNLLGAFIWSFLFVTLGFTFGQSYAFAEEFERILLLSTLALIIIVYSIYFTFIIIEKRKINKITKVGECMANWPG